MSDYWKICVEEAFSQIGINANDKQIEDMVEWVEGAHENYGMAHGHHCIPNPMEEENKKLTKELIREKEKRGCTECGGHGGFNVSVGTSHSSWDRCHVCNGEGKV